MKLNWKFLGSGGWGGGEGAKQKFTFCGGSMHTFWKLLHICKDIFTISLIYVLDFLTVALWTVLIIIICIDFIF